MNDNDIRKIEKHQKIKHKQPISCQDLISSNNIYQMSYVCVCVCVCGCYVVCDREPKK